jgi:hypothetical protein
VNESFARFYFHGSDAVGRLVRFGSRATLHIVGVIGDVRGQSLQAPEGHYARRIYYPFLHGDDTTRLGQPSELRMLIRTNGAPSPLVPALRGAITAVDRTLPIEQIAPLSALVAGSIHEEQLAAEIASAISVLALVMAAIGLFGVLSYSVARRTSEIGIRVALGARGGDIGRMVVLEAMRPVALGVAAGLPLAFASLRLLRQHLTLVSAADPLLVVLATGVLSLCGVLAAAAPARRASRIDPSDALREE